MKIIYIQKIIIEKKIIIEIYFWRGMQIMKFIKF